jgi:hypothetical protein
MRVGRSVTCVRDRGQNVSPLVQCDFSGISTGVSEPFVTRLPSRSIIGDLFRLEGLRNPRAAVKRHRKHHTVLHDILRLLVVQSRDAPWHIRGSVAREAWLACHARLSSLDPPMGAVALQGLACLVSVPLP